MSRKPSARAARQGRTFPASEFKAKCLALLDDVASSRRDLIVTKRGVPVARVVPIDGPDDALVGSLVTQTDLVSPVEDPWDSDA